MNASSPSENQEPRDRPGTRQYLRAPERRQQLIDAAARIAGREGLDRLSMVGLATEAGVSRQLVYEHFPDLPTLVVAVLLDCFGQIDQAIQRAIGDSETTGLAAALLGMRGLLESPAEHRHIVRVLLAHAGVPEHELATIAARFRARSTARWAAVLGMEAGIEDSPGIRALLWGLANVVFGLGDLVDAGEITVDQALEQMSTLILAAFPDVPDASAPAGAGGTLAVDG